jgi:hypothetical protein
MLCIDIRTSKNAAAQSNLPAGLLAALCARDLPKPLAWSRRPVMNNKVCNKDACAFPLCSEPSFTYVGEWYRCSALRTLRGKPIARGRCNRELTGTLAIYSAPAFNGSVGLSSCRNCAMSSTVG